LHGSPPPSKTKTRCHDHAAYLCVYKKKKLYGKKLLQFTIFSRKNYKNNLKNIYKKIK
jgi:hypothetical protein